MGRVRKMAILGNLIAPLMDRGGIRGAAVSARIKRANEIPRRRRRRLHSRLPPLTLTFFFRRNKISPGPPFFAAPPLRH
jgi:hypothetical protein